MSERDEEILTTNDASGRRRFVRRGAGFLLAAGAMTRLGELRADDCDRNGSSASEKQATANSDSDAGGGADPAGCPRQPRDTPKISRAPKATGDEAVTAQTPIRTARIIG